MATRTTPSGSTGAKTSGTITVPPQPATPAVPQEQIAMRAYEKWCQRGCPPGTDQQDWLEAEQELRTELSRPAKPPTR